MKRVIAFMIFVALVLLVSAVVSFGVLSHYLSPVDPSSQSEVRFVINRGQSVTSIGEKLTEAGLVKHPLAFRGIVYYSQLGTRIQAGSFILSPSQSVREIAQALTQGTEDVWVTIPEGYRVEEVAETFAKAGLEDFDVQEFITLAKTSEGYLFPDTYLVPRLITAQEVFALLQRTFDKKVREGSADAIAQSEIDLEDAVIMASLIQREAGKDTSEMRHISGVLWNRIRVGEGLGVDATLQYISGYDAKTGRWWEPPSVAVKESTSPYNTYKYAGLPPAPIANPGVAAILAALDPLETDDFYYIHAGGKIYFAKDLAGHNANINAYLR